MSTPTLTKEQQALLGFFSSMPKTQRTIALRIVEEMAKKNGHAAPIHNGEESQSDDPANHHITTEKAIWRLADSIIGPLGYAESMVDVCFDQLQTNDEKKAINNMIACMDAANVYLKNIRRLCDEAMEGARNG